MNRIIGFIPLLLVFAAACDSDNGCPEGTRDCGLGGCHQCCFDEDCESYDGHYEFCNDDHYCEHIECQFEGDDCPGMWEHCCPGLVCDENYTQTCMPPCTTSEDCRSREDIPQLYVLLCNDGICDCRRCWTDRDCLGGSLCHFGCCTATDGWCGGELSECVILPARAVTKQGMTARFAATPYMISGAVAPGFGFIWSSSDTEVAGVVDGLATGGAATGQSVITAAVQGCPSVTCSADLFNYSAVAAGHTRVVVLDELTQAAVAGATVVVGSESPATTDENGMVELPVELSAGNPQDITVSKADYDYVTLKGVQVGDVIVSLSPLHHLDLSQDPPAGQAGGIKGKFDFGMIRCEPPLKTCDVSFGLAGLSLPPSLVNLGRGVLAKGAIMTEVELGGSKELIKMPAGLVLCLNQTCFKEYFTPTGVPGNRIAWGLGGKLDLADLIDKLGPVISGGWDADHGLLARGLLPLFANFYTAMVPNVDVAPRSMVDDVNDIDGDPATSEVPDYDNFPPQNMTLRIKMDQTMTFIAPALPVGMYDGVVVRGGIIVRGAGFVPLGISLGVDSKDEADPPDGVIDDPIVLNVADVAGRIPEGQYERVIIALAVKLQDDGGPKRWAGQVMFVDSFSGTHTLPVFLPPVVGSFDPQGRRVEILQLPVGADFLQLVFTGENESGWHVLTEYFVSLDLPPAPAEGDRADSAGIYAVDLDSGDYQGLVEFNDLNIGNMIGNLKAFSYSEVPQAGGK